MAESLRQRMAVLRDLMNTNVVTTTPDATVTEAAASMVQGQGGLGGRDAGVVTARHSDRAGRAAGRRVEAEDIRRSPVSAWMTCDPQSASPGTSAEEATQLMLLNGFRRLPVVEGRTVLGVVSLRELFAAGIRRPPAG